MALRKCKKKSISVFSIIFIILLSSLFLFSLNYNQNVYSSINNKNEGSEFQKFKNPQLGAQETLTAVWLENPDFEDDPIEPTWYSEVEGEISDVKATTSPGQINNVIIGDLRIKKIDEELSDTYWDNYSNPDLPITPDTNVINSSGCYVSHLWDEDINQTRNRPSIHWKRIIIMPVNMTGYNITSASLKVSFSASVQALDHDGGGIDREGDSDLDNYSSGDSADFYVLLSDVEETFEPIPVATNNTGAGNLGEDGPPAISNFPDSQMDTIPEGVLIDALTSVLSTNGINFTITLGIDIYCEDNEWGVDVDRWRSLIIRSFNLTFTYEKKINQFTSVSWNQNGDQISDISSDTVIINEAKLNFKYKIDYNWTESSPNSEIRAFINNNKLSETIKLRNLKVNTSFQVAKVGGFNVTSLIPYNTEINFSIQVYLTDEFNLDKNITISFDDIYLNITYTVEFPDFQTNLQVFFNGVNKTSNPIYDHSVGFDLNITVKYPDDNGTHISNALVELSGNISRTFIENETYEQYSIIIDANDLDVGTYYFKIIAHKINFELSNINPIVTVIPTETQDLRLILNGEEKTSDPSMEVPLDSLLNITIKYNTFLDTPITGALIILSGEGILENLNESVSLNQYSIIINSSIKLLNGINLLKIEATKLNYEEQIINPRITVRKIHSVITPVNNSNTIDISPGEDVTLQVYINNTDFDEIIKGAILTYTWEEGQGILEDLNNDGIYESNLTNVPAGTHSVIINAFGSDKYNFISLEIIIVATKPGDASFLFRVLLIVGIIVSIGLGGYLYAYQKVLKFPKAVRKVKKYRRTLRKTNAPRIDIQERKKAFNSAYLKELNKTSKFLKGKKAVEKIVKEKPTEKKSANSKVELINESKNQNINSYNIDNINNDTLNKNIHLRKRFKIRLRKFRQISFKLNKLGKKFYVIIILATMILTSLVIIPNFNQNSFNSILSDKVNSFGISAQETFTKQWLNNTELTSPLNETWYPSYGEFGDSSEVLAINNSDYLNYTVLGDSGIKRIDEVLSDTYWNATNNPKYPIEPDNYGINASGCFISHTWHESVDQTRNTPSMQWKRNITMPVNMSDYKITSASLEVNFSALVQADDHDGGGVEVSGDYTEGQNPPTDTQFGIGDSATFYAQVSDLDNTSPFPIASNKTTNLGRDSPNMIDSHPETPLNVISEDLLKSYLTSVLQADNRNFTITLGIDIYCEDNEYNADIDRWLALIITSFNLTFTYEKKIDQFTSVSWNQDADRVSDLSSDTVVVDKALLNFKYKIDKNWTESSPNSEFRILINGNQHPETVKLSQANSTFQVANKRGGFDITPLIIDDVNLSIQVFIADEFELDDNITISIDDVTLNITYTIIYPDIETDLYLFLNTVNKTDDPNVDIHIGDTLNITVKYQNKTGIHIPNATVQVSGNFTGNLEENKILEQYTITINTEASDAGVNFLTITAQAEDHETKVINLRVTINKFSTEDLLILLNTQNETQDPYIELTTSEILNITVKYTDLIGTYIPGANVLLTSETFTSYLNESIDLKQYSIIIDTNESLRIGTNYMTIEAQAETFQTKIVDITVSIKKINVEITPSSGSNTIETRTGKDIRIQIYLNNTDFGGLVEGAIVTYSWEQGGGILTDTDNDGIYEATIQNIPEGTFPIEISAFAGDDFYIEEYEIIVAASSEVEEENILFPILFTASIILITSLAIYLYAYQTYLKYPRQVRKVRKYRKGLKRESAPSVHIIGREAAFKSLYNENISKLFRLKRHPTKGPSLEQKPTPDKLKSEDISQKIESEDLIDKSLEKKEELDKIVDKSLDENTKPK
ncbi:MAG: hypothetical protein V3V33_15725 [Candidatus Lokiarchaeia archaeon]